MSGRIPRGAGTRWRLLVQPFGRSGRGERLEVQSDRHFTCPPGCRKDHDRAVIVEGSEFDELVVGRWMHIEQIDRACWWMNIGGVVLHVWADRDGRPRTVRVAGPGDHDAPVRGCAYACEWSGPSGQHEAVPWSEFPLADDAEGRAS